MSGANHKLMNIALQSLH